MTIADRPEQGVRREARLPSGTKLRLLENGRVSICHSPCVIDDTLASLLERDFERELHAKRADAQALAETLADLRLRERAAIDAGDNAAREAIFAEAGALTRDLENLRVRDIAEQRGMNPDDVQVLLGGVEGDRAILEQLLGFARNDVDRVLAVLAWAAGDRAALERPARPRQGHGEAVGPRGDFEHPALRPWALRANMRHFVERHTAPYFDLATRRASLTGMWPPGTTREHVEGYLVEAFQKLRDNRELQPPAGENRWQADRRAGQRDPGPDRRDRTATSGSSSRCSTRPARTGSTGSPSRSCASSGRCCSAGADLAEGPGRRHLTGELGWPTGLEPVTFGATIRCSAG